MCVCNSGMDDMKYAGGTFNGLHTKGTIGTSSAYGIVITGTAIDPSLLVSTLTHEEGHGLDMSHDKAGACNSEPATQSSLRPSLGVC